MAPNIKLFICCHESLPVSNHPLLVPIQVGAALAQEHFPGFLHDDMGDNISGKNRSYCELTAQYWAWKNVEADYYGFFHYRRYLYPDTSAKRPYIIKREPSLACLDKLGYQDFSRLIEQYDLILPKGENMYVPVREHYANAPFHHRKDLELVEQIIRDCHPEYADAMETYLSGGACYFGNIYIMRRAVFEDYCNWLFPILKEFDRRADLTGYGPQELRVDGYLAERLLGVYGVFRRSVGRLHIGELPRVHFDALDGGAGPHKRRILYRLLPPGTHRRALIKGFAQPD